MYLITKHFEETPIIFNNDGWINATQTAKAFGKEVRAFMKSKQFKDHEKALLKYHKSDSTKLHITFKGNTQREQGTFLHPDLLIMFARWLSPDFAVWCDMEILKKSRMTLLYDEHWIFDLVDNSKDF